MSALCYLCHRDPNTGELFCVRIGKWVDKCPNYPDGYPWDAESDTQEEDDGV